MRTAMAVSAPAMSSAARPSSTGARYSIAAIMLSTVWPVMVGAEAASPQPTMPLSAWMRTSTLSARLISMPAMTTGFFMGRLTAIGSTRLIFMVSSRLVLLELDQRAEKIAGMEEGDWLARDVVLRPAFTKNADAVFGKSVRGFLYVVDPEAEMMNAALRIALEEFGDRRVGPRRLHQFDLAVAEFDIGEAYALLDVLHARPNREPVFRVELPRRRFEIRHDDRDMTQSGDHGQVLR